MPAKQQSNKCVGYLALKTNIRPYYLVLICPDKCQIDRAFEARYPVRVLVLIRPANPSHAGSTINTDFEHYKLAQEHAPCFGAIGKKPKTDLCMMGMAD